MDNPFSRPVHNGSPRFTEQFNVSPPNQAHQSFEGDNDPSTPHYVIPLESPIQRNLSTKRSPPLFPSEIDATYPEFYDNSEGKEVVIPPVLPEAYDRPSVARIQKRRACGLPLLGVLIIAGLIVALAIGLGVGLGLGLSDGKDSSQSNSPSQDVNTEYLIGGAINPNYYSTEGAFNGSGIALASQSFSRDLQEGTQGSIVMYFQHYTGQIRWKQLSTTGEWLGGDISEVVASDARNGTALSAVAYDLNGSSTWHVFYIAQDNTIKQRTNSNDTNVWVDGPLNDMNVEAMDADTTGMQACWYGNNYGDSDYDHTPLPNEDPVANRSSEVGMHLWYAKDNTTFQQLGWREGDDGWEFQQTFTGMNGHAGIGCYSWGPGTVTYVMMVNLEQTVEIWWKDTNTNLTTTDSHPINIWTNSSIAINDVHPSTSLGYTRFLYTQDATSLLLKGYNISFAAENSTIDDETSFTVQGEPGLPGTHLSVSAIPNLSGGDDLIVFYQTNGSDISEFTRDLYAGQWASVSIDIPQ